MNILIFKLTQELLGLILVCWVF